MANKVNYNNETLKIIDEIKISDKKYKLLLHVCCAPCSSYVLEWLIDYFDIYIDFYNPNLDSVAEYDRRLDEVRKFINEILKIKPNAKINLVFGDYKKEDFKEIAGKRAKMQEGDIACHNCYELRLRHSANMARMNDCDYFTTTLSISPMKSSQVLNELGIRIQDEFGVKYLLSDFKKQNGYKRSIELSKEYDLYRQDYCGCIYSKQERDRRLQNENS